MAAKPTVASVFNGGFAFIAKQIVDHEIPGDRTTTKESTTFDSATLDTTSYFGSDISESGNITDLLGNLTDPQVLDLPKYYSPLYKTIGCFFVTVIFVVGIFGNVMVVTVVWRTKSMHTTTNCHLVSLAFADIILLISAPLPTIAEYFLIVDQSVFGSVGCSLMVFFQYLGVNLSSLSITAFSVERYIAICHPMRAHTMCTISRAKRIIFCLWLFGIAYCVPWVVLVTARQHTFSNGVTIESCTFKLARKEYLIYYMADLVLFYVVPLVLTCILYGLIASVLNSSVRLGTPGLRRDTARRDMVVKKANGTMATASNMNNQKSSSRVQVTKMLAVVVCVFAVLWLPYRAYVVYNSFARHRFKDLWFLLFCRLMVYINSAINPILYNAMSVKFRWAFRRLLFCGKHPPLHDGISQYTQVSHATSAAVAQEYVELRSACSATATATQQRVSTVHHSLQK